MSELKTAISTPAAPAAIGPYSQAILSGDFLFASGQIGLDPTSLTIVEGGIIPQTERVLQNIQAILAEARLDVNNVIKTTIFLKNMDDFATVNAAYAEFFTHNGAVPPARSTVEVARLPKDALVEIEIIARCFTN